MWTCGIDIATQQDSPAMVSSTCSARGDSPSERTCHAPRAAIARAFPLGDGPRRTSATGSMVASAEHADRPGTSRASLRVAMKCWSTGGQSVPDR